MDVLNFDLTQYSQNFIAQIFIKDKSIRMVFCVFFKNKRADNLNQ